MPPKSGYSRTRNIDYDEDDIYEDMGEYYDDENEYEEGAQNNDGMTEDDREQMRLGTIRVREALGTVAEFTSDAQIQDTLWHYYYDVGKSVTYLKNQLGLSKDEEPAKKETVTSRFDQAANMAAKNAPAITTGKHTHIQFHLVKESKCPVTSTLPSSLAIFPAASHSDFFLDVPWGKIPMHRQGNIVCIPSPNRGGLLGGSSKLAALAAKRRKEREDAKATIAATKPTVDTDAAIHMLDQLTLKGRENPALQTRSGERGQEGAQAQAARYNKRRRSPAPQTQAVEDKDSTTCGAHEPAVTVESPARRATASMFATTLCGSSRPLLLDSATMQAFPVPYTSYKDYNSVDPFEGPSPDDIVRTAQAQGQGGGRR